MKKIIRASQPINAALTIARTSFGDIDENSIPYNMRYKEWDEDDRGIFWVTQEWFTEDDLNQFADIVAPNMTGNFQFHITVRDNRGKGLWSLIWIEDGEINGIKHNLANSPEGE